MKFVKLLAAAMGCAAVATVSTASAAVLGVTIADASSGNYTLTSITISRSGAGTFTYLPGQLTGVDVTDIAATGNSIAVQSGASVPAAGTRATMLEDGRLDTGLINPFSTGAPATDAFEVTFLSPITNSTGADIVIFDLGAGDPTAFWVNDDRVNNRHDVDADDFNTNLLTGMPFTQYAYANPVGGSSNVNGLSDLEAASGWSGTGANGSTAVAAIELDLSDFGIAPGATVTSLRWQTTSTGNRLDAVYVAGLPAVPEPAGLAMLGLIAGAVFGRRARG